MSQQNGAVLVMQEEQVLGKDVAYSFEFLAGQDCDPFLQCFPLSEFLEEEQLFQLIELSAFGVPFR